MLPTARAMRPMPARLARKANLPRVGHSRPFGLRSATPVLPVVHVPSNGAVGALRLSAPGAGSSCRRLSATATRAARLHAVRRGLAGMEVGIAHGARASAAAALRSLHLGGRAAGAGAGVAALWGALLLPGAGRPAVAFAEPRGAQEVQLPDKPPVFVHPYHEEHWLWRLAFKIYRSLYLLSVWTPFIATAFAAFVTGSQPVQAYAIKLLVLTFERSGAPPSLLLCSRLPGVVAAG